MTVPEAAEALGITADAVRSRIKRGTLPTVREGGRVFVVVDATDQPTARAQATTPAVEDRLYEEMRERIRYLEHQVEEERETRQRADTLLARLMDRVPELETSPEQRGSEAAETPPSEAERESAQPPAEAEDRRPWWRRWFG
jgi:excisionase family DNA binding protein